MQFGSLLVDILVARLRVLRDLLLVLLCIGSRATLLCIIFAAAAAAAAATR